LLYVTTILRVAGFAFLDDLGLTTQATRLRLSSGSLLEKGEGSRMVWTPRDITKTETAVLRILWKQGTATIRELTDQLYPDGGHAHYATVQSLLDRLEKKGCVTRSKQGRINLFAATITRAQMIRRRIRDTADSLCDGSLAPLLTHLVKTTHLSPEELADLKKLVDRLAEEGPRKAGGEDRGDGGTIHRRNTL
jgi:predicted transcriptional regulator